jgi:hypothetical protein
MSNEVAPVIAVVTRVVTPMTMEFAGISAATVTVAPLVVGVGEAVVACPS